jgi:hypothetical protein
MLPIPVGLLGIGFAMFGFLAMRDPMLLTLEFRSAEGYYQRMVLDRLQRIQLRLLGMLISFFGCVVFTAALGGLLRLPVVEAFQDAFLGLLWLVFVGAFGLGIIYLAIQLVRGRAGAIWSDWFRIYKNGMELGPIAVFPGVTPRMRRERRAFAIAFYVLVALAIAVSWFPA